MCPGSYFHHFADCRVRQAWYRDNDILLVGKGRYRDQHSTPPAQMYTELSPRPQEELWARLYRVLPAVP
jgi:hypothetical protein